MTNRQTLPLDVEYLAWLEIGNVVEKTEVYLKIELPSLSVVALKAGSQALEATSLDCNVTLPGSLPATPLLRIRPALLELSSLSTLSLNGTSILSDSTRVTVSSSSVPTSQVTAVVIGSPLTAMRVQLTGSTPGIWAVLQQAWMFEIIDSTSIYYAKNITFAAVTSRTTGVAFTRSVTEIGLSSVISLQMNLPATDYAVTLINAPLQCTGCVASGNDLTLQYTNSLVTFAAVTNPLTETDVQYRVKVVSADGKYLAYDRLVSVSPPLTARPGFTATAAYSATTTLAPATLRV